MGTFPYRKGYKKGMKPRMKQIEDIGRARSGGMRGYYSDIPKFSPPPEVGPSDSILDIYPPRGKRKEAQDYSDSLADYLS